MHTQILNLHPDISDDDLRELFRPFGEINYVKVERAPGAAASEAFVQYADKPMADNAIKHFNGFEIAGRRLTVQVRACVLGGLVCVHACKPKVDNTMDDLEIAGRRLTACVRVCVCVIVCACKLGCAEAQEDVSPCINTNLRV